MAVSGFVSGKFHMSSKWKKIMSIVALCLFGAGRVLAQSSNEGGQYGKSVQP